MQTRQWKDSDLFPSRLGFGCMRLPTSSPRPSDIDVPAAGALIDRALSCGVTYFDTAYPYHGGASEGFIGSALANYPRDQWLLASKLPGWMVKTREDAERIFNEQLSRCGVDYFDFYLLHAVGRKGLRKYGQTGVYEFLRAKKESGQIKRVGFSFHDTPDIFAETLTQMNWDFCQLQLNYLDWVVQDGAELYRLAGEAGLPIVVMEPLRGGALASLRPEAEAIFRAVHPDWTNAEWAFRFLCSLDGVQVILSGMSDAFQVEDNLRIFKEALPFGEAEQAAIDKVRALIMAQQTIGCTKCGYCSACPSRIPISGLFGLYNEYAASGDSGHFARRFAALTEKSADCISCGACAEHCPQHIAIPDELARLRRLAGK